MIIRKLSIEDYDALISLWESAGLPYKPKGRDRKDKIENELKGSNAIFLVAEIDGKIVGAVLGTHDGRKGWINRLAVSPDYRRKGIATKLIEEVEKHFEKIGLEVFACLIEDGNSASMKTVEKLGYEKRNDIIYFVKKKNKDA